jgi:hypothetical protein
VGGGLGSVPMASRLISYYRSRVSISLQRSQARAIHHRAARALHCSAEFDRSPSVVGSGWFCSIGRFVHCDHKETDSQMWAFSVSRTASNARWGTLGPGHLIGAILRYRTVRPEVTEDSGAGARRFMLLFFDRKSLRLWQLDPALEIACKRLKKLTYGGLDRVPYGDPLDKFYCITGVQPFRGYRSNSNSSTH